MQNFRPFFDCMPLEDPSFFFPWSDLVLVCFVHQPTVSRTCFFADGARKLFKKFDKDGSGFIDSDEVCI
jgi:hypothetical protein